MILHWIRQTSLQQWLQQQPTLPGTDDALLLTDAALQQLPATTPTARPVYALAEETSALPLPDYVQRIDDAQWLRLVLNYPQQITW